MVHDAQSLLRGDVSVAKGERVVVIGGSATGCETAEHLIGEGAEVTIIEMRPGVGFGIEAITRRHLIRELKRQGVKLLTSAKVIMIEDDHVLYEAEGETLSVPADRVALALGFRPTGIALAAQIEGPQVLVLGDASRPADFVSAINSGADAGLTV
jgi:pyruvate/2-oxoglutarate dehydrogenase complex dihydrolipoamide dehydrogenase (E3) component